MSRQSPALFNLEPSFTNVRDTVSLDPPAVRCDGCGLTAMGPDVCLVILTCGITFNPRLFPADQRRLCRECKKTEWNQS